MKRPLEDNEPALDPALKDLLIAQMCPTWHGRLRLKLYWAARHAFKIPIACTSYNTKAPYMIFESLEDVLQRLDLMQAKPYLQTNHTLRYPVEAPAIDKSRHFAQWAAVWQPVKNDLRAHRTLVVEVGAGFHLLSLKFTPLKDDASGQRMQLDEAILRHGHEVFTIETGRDYGDNSRDRARTAQIFAAAQATIELIHHDYPLAETALADGVRDALSGLRAEEQEYLRREAADAQAVSHLHGHQNGGNPGLYKPQEP